MPTVIDGWQIVRSILHQPDAWERFIVEDAQGKEALLTLYRTGAEPDPAVHNILRKMDRDHVPELLATGRFDNRAYEVTEIIIGGSLADVGYFAAGSIDALRRVVDELGRALDSFAALSLRHRDLNPRNVLIRSLEPLDLVITGFGSARLSDFDLDAIAPLELTWYSSPEAIVGGVSSASDWWSLGVILLEHATKGHCFKGVNDKAFQIHVVTRGISIPEDLDDSIRLLLRGLLARDPLKRWQWPQVKLWLSGESVDAPNESGGAYVAADGPFIELNKRRFYRPEAYALAAVEAQHWEQACTNFSKGAVTTWLEERNSDATIVAAVRRLASDEELSENYRHALGMMALNSSLPLALNGEIVTPVWLLANPKDGYEAITGPLTRHLERMRREQWLVRLRTRAEAVRNRAKQLEIELDENRVRQVLLVSSRSNLDAERNVIRMIYPDSNHGGLVSLIENDRLFDEELIILVSAAQAQFVALDTIVDNAQKLAHQFSIPNFDIEATEILFRRSRREIYAEVEARTAGFASCPIQKINEWAESFRIERRISLPRAALVLTVPRAHWHEPPKQQYVEHLLDHFEKRVVRSVQRGPLVRFTIGKTTARIDLCELASALQPGDAMLDHLLKRTSVPIKVDPMVFATNERVLSRYSRLCSHALTFKRDTAIDGRYMAFPFLVVRDARLASTDAKIRIAPVLLWPIAIALTPGASGIASIAFDQEREEIRLNPALDGLLSPEEITTWRQVHNELLRRTTIRVSDVIDAFGELAPPVGRKLAPIPGKDCKLEGKGRVLACAAALFNAEFTGQFIAEDLRVLKKKPPKDTALETALRVSTEPRSSPAIAARLEPQDQFLTVACDPSQEAAVAKARLAPGVLVEGPPGTGKSQTIVNIVADCIGRGETALIVCQKQAALRVVQKRLEAEGLGNRIFAIIDVTRDRDPILRALREQLEQMQTVRSGDLTQLRRTREAAASRISTLELELNKQYESVNHIDDLAGLSYRNILSELIQMDRTSPSVAAPSLRKLLSPLGRSQISSLDEICGPLASLWLKARYEGSALAVMKSFQIDEAGATEVISGFQAFVASEARRNIVEREQISSFEIDDPSPYRSWLDQHEHVFRKLPSMVRRDASRWLDLFRTGATGLSAGRRLIAHLRTIIPTLHEASCIQIDPALLHEASKLAPIALKNWLAISENALAEVSLFRRLSVRRFFNRRKCKKHLEKLGRSTIENTLLAWRDALTIEFSLRPLRESVVATLASLKQKQEQQQLVTAQEVKSEAEFLLGSLEPAGQIVEAALSFPCTETAERMVRANSIEAFDVFCHDIEAALQRHAARGSSKATLRTMEPWFADDWVKARHREITSASAARGNLDLIVAALPTLSAYQRFRARASQLDELALQVFSALRPLETALGGIPDDQLDTTVRCTILREAFLSWIARLQTAKPSLLIQHQEIDQKVLSLAKAELELRAANCRLLANDIDPKALRPQSDWEEITRLRGPRARKLREVISVGADLGLKHLRPIWLMTPETVSRVLPLSPGQYDVVIFDEASQLLVEHAVPALYRAKRVVISGDEKQMPPTSFFSSRLGSDEDNDFDGVEPDEAATDTEKDIYEETWNRREIKDCPDLLALGHTCLPITSLQIHYRSKYRDLITYSNAAFYKGTLSVPVHHPDAEIKRAQPIQVIRANGVYESQTNTLEAKMVADVLASIWTAPAGKCPSVGVVTFNLKQADIVEDEIAKRASVDPAFLAAYQREGERLQNGEDMGFFVKNVETVQGDERDIIIFSTTFGPDSRGSFRRNFGALGQLGGERRLNVAVTRAREKVIIITSMPIGDISDALSNGRGPSKPRDYLQGYLDFASKISAGDVHSARSAASKASAQHVGPTRKANGSDGFTDAVTDFLKGLGHKALSADTGDAFGVDLAVEDPKTGHFGIAIECDAPQDRHGQLATARAREIWRPSVLRRAYPVVHRVSSQAWYFDGAAERARLRLAVEQAFDKVQA